MLLLIYLPFKSSRHIVIALVGNKIDMEVSRTVEFNEAKSYADENDLIFMETSAKTNVNINETLRVIGECFKRMNNGLILIINYHTYFH